MRRIPDKRGKLPGKSSAMLGSVSGEAYVLEGVQAKEEFMRDRGRGRRLL